MHPNEPQLFWQAAMTARALASRTDSDGLVEAWDAIDEVAAFAAFAAHASPQIARRAQELIGRIASDAPSKWLQAVADEALQKALDCRAALPSP